MKGIGLVLMVYMTCPLFFAQNSNSQSINSKNSMFAESFGSNKYASSIIYKAQFKDTVAKILNENFDGRESKNSIVTWSSLKEANNENNKFYVEQKNGSIKIEWKNTVNVGNDGIIEKLKRISREILGVVEGK